MNKSRRSPRTAFDRTVIVVLDHWYTGSIALLWFTYAMWGLAASINRLPVLVEAVGVDVSFAYVVGMGVSALIASLGAIFLRAKLEFYSLLFFLALLIGYGTVSIATAYVEHGEYFARAILVLSVTIMPMARVRYLSRKIKGTSWTP